MKILETTIVQQIEVIDRQNEEIENWAKQVTQETAHVVVSEREAAQEEGAVKGEAEEGESESHQELQGDPALQWHQVTASGRRAPRQNNIKRTVPNWDCEECRYQTTEGTLLKDHVKSMHRITCFTCQEMF